MEANSRITIDDIARRLDISRTTVSKALNGKCVPERTRDKVLSAATELGYKSFHLIRSKQSKHRKILLLAAHPLMSTSFFVRFIRGIESLIPETKIELIHYTLLPDSGFLDDINEMVKNIKPDGIIGLEFYKADAIMNILSLNIPVVFFDFCPRPVDTDKAFDVILPISAEVVKAKIAEFAKDGCRHIWFMGEPSNCRAFYERYNACQEACAALGIRFSKRSEAGVDLQKVIKNEIIIPNGLPNVMFCGNDYEAINLLYILRRCKIAVPDCVRVIGFDNIPESAFTVPPLSTFNIDKHQFGRSALNCLLERIADPAVPRRFIYLQTNYVPRQT